MLNLVSTTSESHGRVASQDEALVYSGPQVGEPLPAFQFRELLLDPEAGDVDLVTQAADHPLLLVFVHEANRPSIALTRLLTSYAKSRSDEGLKTGVIFLDRDPTEAEGKLKRMQHALTPGVPTGVSLDGQEGPGSLGLNRQVTLTILIAQKRQIVANFALVQPSLAADLPRILESLVALVGGRAPTVAELEASSGSLPRPAANDPPNLRPLLAPLIQKTATEADVERAASAVEAAAQSDTAIRREVGRIARTIVEAGVVQNYGTATAQDYLKKWAKEFDDRTDK